MNLFNRSDLALPIKESHHSRYEEKLPKRRPSHNLKSKRMRAWISSSLLSSLFFYIIE